MRGLQKSNSRAAAAAARAVPPPPSTASAIANLFSSASGRYPCDGMPPVCVALAAAGATMAAMIE